MWDRLREEFPESKRQGVSVGVEKHVLTVSHRDKGIQIHVTFQQGQEPTTSITMAMEYRRVELSSATGISFANEPAIECAKKIATIIEDILR